MLDPNIRNLTLHDAVKTYVTDGACKLLGIAVDHVLVELHEKLTVNSRQLTFGDLESRPLHCEGLAQPYKRCLNFQASIA